jgi:indolepyruvate ferredoxin oxidoreductase
MLGLDETPAAALGIRIYKVGMVWPLEPSMPRASRAGCRRSSSSRKSAPSSSTSSRSFLQLSRPPPPDSHGRQVRRRRRRWILPSDRRADRRRDRRRHRRETAGALPRSAPASTARLRALEAPRLLALPRANFPRALFLLRLPAQHLDQGARGSRALAGIGCHYMATWMDRSTDTFTHMGGEGVTWVGQAPFTETPHIFQNLGDGTYFHSGSLAIRQAIAPASTSPTRSSTTTPWR